MCTIHHQSQIHRSAFQNPRSPPYPGLELQKQSVERPGNLHPNPASSVLFNIDRPVNLPLPIKYIIFNLNGRSLEILVR